jgi:hypothetical protein
LFYWQIIRGDDLQLAVTKQTQRKLSKIRGKRSNIFSGWLVIGRKSAILSIAGRQKQLEIPQVT